MEDGLLLYEIVSFLGLGVEVLPPELELLLPELELLLLDVEPLELYGHLPPSCR